MKRMCHSQRYNLKFVNIYKLISYPYIVICVKTNIIKLLILNTSLFSVKVNKYTIQKSSWIKTFLVEATHS